MSVEALGYGSFSNRLQNRAHVERIPLNGTFEVTHRCPLTCSHCYNNLAVGDRNALSGELTLDEQKRILDEMGEAGTMWLLLTGGEVFARRDFLDTYRHARRAGMLVTIFTNGVMITPAIADALVKEPPFSLEITIYGRTRETYDALTGIPGAFDRCMRGIQLLKERNLPLKLKSVAVTMNRHEIWDMKRFAEEEIGVPFKMDAMLNPRIDCSSSPLAVRLSPEEVVALDLEDDGRAQEWLRIARDYNRPPAPNAKIYKCGGGLNSYAVDPEGQMTICVLSRVDRYDLRRGTFREGWENFLAQVRDKPTTRPTKCSGCSIRALCGTCAATNELENGDAEAPVDFMCEVAHLRAHALGHPPHPHEGCAFCAEGSERTRMLAAADRLKAGVAAQIRRPRGLRVVATAEAGCGTGGCGSCSTGEALDAGRSGGTP